MSDDQKQDRAVWAFIELYALGAVFHGFDVMRPDGLTAAAGWWIAGGILAVIGWHWAKVRRWISPRLAATTASIATDARWWVATAILFLLVGTFSRFVEERRWPYSLASVPLDIGRPAIHPVPELTELSLRAAMAADFQGAWQNNADYTLKIDGKDVEVRITDFRDAHDGAEFLGAYIPRTSETFAIAKDILAGHDKLLGDLGKGGMAIRALGQTGDESADNVVFTNRIYIYYEGDLNLDQLGQLEKLSKSMGLTTIWRGSEYLATEKWKIPDAKTPSH